VTTYRVPANDVQSFVFCRQDTHLRLVVSRHTLGESTPAYRFNAIDQQTRTYVLPCGRRLRF